MNILPFHKQTEIVAALTEGVSIRATERLTGAHRDTIMRLGVRVGIGCDKLHNTLMRGLHVPRLELDEAWSFVGKKQKKVTEDDGANKGDQYVFITLAGAAKAIVSYWVGKRNLENTNAFLWDVRERVLGYPRSSRMASTPTPTLSRKRSVPAAPSEPSRSITTLRRP